MISINKNNWLIQLKTFFRQTNWALFFTWSASLSFYFALALSPLLLLGLAFLGKWGYLFKNAVLRNFKDNLTPNDLNNFEIFFNRVDHIKYSGTSGLLTILFLLVSYITFILHCRRTFDAVLQQSNFTPQKINSDFFIVRLSYLAILSFVVFFLLFVMVFLSYAVPYYLKKLSLDFGFIEFIFSFFLKFLFFGWIAMVIPSRPMPKNIALKFAAVAAVLYALGNKGLKLYFTLMVDGSAAEISGSIMVLLTWFYYSALVTLLSLQWSANKYSNKMTSLPSQHATEDSHGYV